jgi:hypothetical protein
MHKKWRNLLIIIVIIVAIVAGYLFFVQNNYSEVSPALKSVEFSSFIGKDASLVDSKVSELKTIQGLSPASKEYAEIEVLALGIIKKYNSAKVIESSLGESENICTNLSYYKEMIALVDECYSDSNILSQKLNVFSVKYPSEYKNLENSLFSFDDLKFVSFEEIEYLIGLSEEGCNQ